MSGEDDRKFYEICINSIETEVSKIESTEESLTETNRGQVLDLCEKCAKNIHFVLENWLSKENREKYLAEKQKQKKFIGAELEEKQRNTGVYLYIARRKKFFHRTPSLLLFYRKKHP